MHRRWVIAAGPPGGGLSTRRVLWQFIGLAELLVMGATSGVAVALGRSAPPQGESLAPRTLPRLLSSPATTCRRS